MFKEILSELSCDMDWDPANKMHEIFIAKGIKRYDLVYVSSLFKTNKGEVSASEMTSETDRAGDKKSLMDMEADSANASSSSIQIKVEVVEKLELNKVIVVVRTGEGKIPKIVKELKACRATCQQLKKSESANSRTLRGDGWIFITKRGCTMAKLDG